MFIEPSDGITKYHPFTFRDGEENLTSYGYKVFDSEVEAKLSKDLKPSSRTSTLSKDFTPGKRKEYLLSIRENLDIISAPGLSEQKQCEFNFNWSQLVPDEWYDEVCPRHGADCIAKFMKQKGERKVMHEE